MAERHLREKCAEAESRGYQSDVFSYADIHELLTTLDRLRAAAPPPAGRDPWPVDPRAPRVRGTPT
jgi:hypothetical protein